MQCWPTINGRRYLGACPTYDQASDLARLYGGVIEEPGIRLAKDEMGNYHFGGLLQGWYAVFIDKRRFADPDNLKVETDTGRIDMSTPALYRGL